MWGVFPVPPTVMFPILIVGKSKETDFSQLRL